MIKLMLIIAYFAIFVTITVCFKNDARERVITDSRKSSKSSEIVRQDSTSESISDSVNNSSTSTSNDSNAKGIKQKETSNRSDIKCGEDITVFTSREITSPSYPSKYPSNLDCKWNVRAQNGQIIKIQIFKLNIENDNDCRFDYLDIKGVKKLCGRMSDAEITVNSTNIELIFHSDANKEDFGFHLRIIAESRDCVRRLNVTNYAYVTSPNFPANYDDSSDCWTLITTEKGLTLVLTFELLHLEHDQHCAYDYLEVFDSQFANNSLGKLCDKPENVTLSLESSSNALLLHFHSDQLLNSKGFRAEVTTSRISLSDHDCDWKVDWKKMTINSPSYPNNYPPNLNCELIISSPSPDEKVVILFDWIHFEVGANCNNSDRLEMWENDFSPSRVICGRKTQQFKYISQNKTVKLKFISDEFAEFPGFTARVTFLDNTEDKSKPSFKINSKILRSPENASVIIGSTHVLYCEPVGNYIITWFKDDQTIKTGVSADGTSLIIKEFTIRSVGRYICKFGKDYREAWLKVRETNCPSVIFRKRPKDQSVSEGEFVMLECNVADSKIGISWQKDGRLVPNNSRVHQLSNGYLILDPAMSEDSGIYFCVADSESANCEVRSGARVSVNQRANLNAVCGISHSIQEKSTDNSKIIGGTDAVRDAFPWHVMFWDYRRKSFCGAALLNERWVITAAHCFETGSESSIEVRLGKYDQTVTEETEIVTKIAEIRRHPDFSRETFDNDLALVRLANHITFTPHIIPICLVDKMERKELEDYYLNSKNDLRLGHVTGWGQLKENGPQPRFLQELRMPIVEVSKCRASTAFKVTSNMFCAGYGKEVLGDACKGDSGGPFVVPYKSRWILLGVVSWGEGCGRNGKYGFYTKINNYLDWINAIIKL